MLCFPHWYKEVLSNSSPNEGQITWAPMWKYDSDVLEIENNSSSSSSSSSTLKQQQKLVYVENRREVVNLEQRQLSSCYDSNIPIKKIIRGTWFYFYSTTKSFLPLNEEIANRLEVWFQGLKTLTSINGDPIRADVEMNLTLSHKRNPEYIKYKITAIKEVTASSSSTSTSGTTATSSADSKINDSLIDGFSITMKSLAFNDLFGGTIQLARGVKVTPDAEEAWCGTEVDHLIFVVHGIGQTMFAKSDLSFKNNISSIRKLTLEQQEVLFQQEQEQYNNNGSKSDILGNIGGGGGGIGLGSQGNNGNNSVGIIPSSILTQYGNKKRIEYIPIEWYDAMRTNDTSLSNDLNLVTLPNLQVVRQIANEVVLDILLYLTPEYRDKILTYVCSKIIQMYTIFIELNPSFLLNHGKCSLIGHSLGTVILFDLLSNQRRESIIGNNIIQSLFLFFNNISLFSSLSFSLPSIHPSFLSSLCRKLFNFTISSTFIYCIRITFRIISLYSK